MVVQQDEASTQRKRRARKFRGSRVDENPRRGGNKTCWKILGNMVSALGGSALSTVPLRLFQIEATQTFPNLIDPEIEKKLL